MLRGVENLNKDIQLCFALIVAELDTIKILSVEGNVSFVVTVINSWSAASFITIIQTRYIHQTGVFYIYRNK